MMPKTPFNAKAIYKLSKICSEEKMRFLGLFLRHRLGATYWNVEVLKQSWTRKFLLSRNDGFSAAVYTKTFSTRTHDTYMLDFQASLNRAR